MATMRRPDIFKAGVSGAPVTDWRDYDTHYTGRYIGLPDQNKAGYDASDVLTYAKDLKAVGAAKERERCIRNIMAEYYRYL